MNLSRIYLALHALGFVALRTTWANRPTSPRLGQRIRLTDYGNREFYWNGTVWQQLGAQPWAQSATPVSVTGTLTETTLATITIPGGMMGPNGSLRIRALFGGTNSANSKTMRVRLAGSAMATSAGFTTSDYALHQVLVANRNAQNSQLASYGTAQAGTGSVTVTAVDTSVDQLLTITGQLASAGETLTLQSFLVEALPS